MRKCPKCEIEKEDTMFHKNKSSKTGLCCYCKECSNKKETTRYSKDIGASREYRKGLNMKNGDVKRKYIYEYLASHPCIDCGEADPIVLEFDHVRGDKLGPVSELMRNNGLEKLKTEIDKCDVRCANCHRRKTAVDFKYYSRIMES